MATVCEQILLTTAPDQLARDRERLAELEAWWSSSILDLSHDDAMRWYRTGKEIRELRRQIEAAEKEEGKRAVEVPYLSEPIRTWP